ncbi:hypothetical protein BO71DRAFT_405144 [Aspergillus ellipticus CBS 707.79]|uniref:Uncharacterized protein n=1 Tax=Aspergillus ellipticus CBS 707.79 TaxID=1448320 RepID=A0A319E055_9EURO|nr:hypothetical protein BO71DRAFT_405144 [Aspergillus ellipticus CBS 707.79]
MNDVGSLKPCSIGAPKMHEYLTNSPIPIQYVINLYQSLTSSPSRNSFLKKRPAQDKHRNHLMQHSQGKRCLSFTVALGSHIESELSLMIEHPEYADQILGPFSLGSFTPKTCSLGNYSSIWHLNYETLGLFEKQQDSEGRQWCASDFEDIRLNSAEGSDKIQLAI